MKQRVLHIGDGNLSLRAAVAAMLHGHEIRVSENPVFLDAVYKPEPTPIEPPTVIHSPAFTQEDNWFKKQCKKRGQVTNIPVPSFHEGMNRKQRREDWRKFQKEQKKK